MRCGLNENDYMVKIFGDTQESALGIDVDSLLQVHGNTFKPRRCVHAESFLSDVVTPLQSLQPSGMNYKQGRHVQLNQNLANVRMRQRTSFGLFSKDDDGDKEDLKKLGTPDKPKSYCCKGYKDASDECTGYRVDRGCMANFLHNPKFEKMQEKADDFAESSKPTYCCKRGSRFCLRGIWVKHEELEGAPPQEGKVEGSNPISTSDIIENAQNCVFKHNMQLRGCRYRDVNIAIPHMPPQGKNFQKCHGEVPQLPSRASRGLDDECINGKYADGEECQDDSLPDKECKGGKDKDGKECKEPELEDKRNLPVGKDKKDEEKEKELKNSKVTPEENQRRQEEKEEKNRKRQETEDEENAESNEQREIELMAQEEVRKYVPKPQPPPEKAE